MSTARGALRSVARMCARVCGYTRGSSVRDAPARRALADARMLGSGTWDVWRAAAAAWLGKSPQRVSIQMVSRDTGRGTLGKKNIYIMTRDDRCELISSLTSYRTVFLEDERASGLVAPQELLSWLDVANGDPVNRHGPSGGGASCDARSDVGAGRRVV